MYSIFYDILNIKEFIVLGNSDILYLLGLAHSAQGVCALAVLQELGILLLIQAPPCQILVRGIA